MVPYTGSGYNTTGCAYTSWVQLQQGAAATGCGYKWVGYKRVRLHVSAAITVCGYNNVRLQQGAATTGCSGVRLQQGAALQQGAGFNKVRAKVSATSTGIGSFKTTFLVQILPETSQRQIENATIQYL